MKIGIIGTGYRSTVYTQTCLDRKDADVQITALCDVNESKLQDYATYFFGQDKPRLYTDYRELLVDQTIDSVIITSVDGTHREIAIEAMHAGKHMILEKPIATTIEDAIAIWQESERYPTIVQLGFGLRYMRAYVKAKELLTQNRIGRIISIEAKEVLGHLHAGSFFRRWHRFRANNGGFLNAKCSHDMDMLNWMVDSTPRYVSAFGTRTYFVPREGAGNTCTDCKYRNSCRYCYHEKDYGAFSPVENLCVYNIEKDLVDHEVVNILYENGVTASFTVSMLSADANRTLCIFGTEATLTLDFMTGTVRVKDIAGVTNETYQYDDLHLPHGGADPILFETFVNRVKNGEQYSDAKAGARSTAIALAAEQSMQSHQTVDFASFIGVS